MSVRYRFTIEIYGFTHSLCTFVSRDAHDAIPRNGVGGQGLGRTGVDTRKSPEIWKMVN